MRGNWVRATFISTLTLTAICLAIISPAQAENIVPWMTGDFYSGDAFGFGYPSTDGKFFDLSFTVDIEGFNWGWYCYDPENPYNCLGRAHGTITGGTVTGRLFSDWDTANPTLDATFTGSVTGGEVRGYAAWYFGSYSEWDEYSYAFKGYWTNGWLTSALQRPAGRLMLGTTETT